MNYILRAQKNNWRLLTPRETVNTLEFVESMSDLWLTTDVRRDDSGQTYKYYRLHARLPHSIEQALAYDIKCPRCGNHMKQVARSLNTHDLGLYMCPVCEGHKYRR